MRRRLLLGRSGLWKAPRSGSIPEGYDLDGASPGRGWLLKLELLWAFHPRRAVRPVPHANHPETTGKTKSPRRRPTTMAYDTVLSLRKLRKRLSTKILCQTGTSLADSTLFLTIKTSKHLSALHFGCDSASHRRHSGAETSPQHPPHTEALILLEMVGFHLLKAWALRMSGLCCLCMGS